NIDTFPGIAASAGGKFPKYRDRMLDLHARRYDTIRSAYEAGVPIYLGTDAGGHSPHGMVAAEALELERSGMSRVEVCWAATWWARGWLGRAGLVEGDPSELVVVKEDPVQDLGVLSDPVAIVLRGRVVG